MDNKHRNTHYVFGRATGKTAAMVEWSKTQMKAGGGLTDTSLMPFGKHKGEKMANVPADYLIWCFDNNKCNPAVRAYISANEHVLRFQAKQIPKR